MKNIVLIKFLIIFLLSINPVLASKTPNIPKGIDNAYCDKKGGSFGHVIVVIDLTTTLDEARIDFIKDQVFSKEFYMNYDPFTKFSYFLVNHNEPTKQKFLFSKCRPKTGDGNLSKNEKATLFENSKVLKVYSSRFFNEANELHHNIFSVKKDSRYSYIYETIAYIFQNPKADFKSNHSYRELIVVSDLMQNTKRLSFYSACNANSNNALCPSFEDFMENLSDKDYLIATSPDGNNINLKMVYLNNRCETNKSLDQSLKLLWENYFKSRDFNVLETIHQTDINILGDC
tara:strand:- start:1342 stop:2205 length:864 start_codon:yes stop_codon:yes gene_type:complete